MPEYEDAYFVGFRFDLGLSTTLTFIDLYRAPMLTEEGFYASEDAIADFFLSGFGLARAQRVGLVGWLGLRLNGSIDDCSRGRAGHSQNFSHRGCSTRKMS